MHYEVRSIGTIKVGAEGMALHLDPQYIPALEALEGFSHLSVLWWFSHLDSEEYRNILTVPKPYTSAPETMGIFATRSPVRPNPLALTTVEVLGIDHKKGIVEIPYIDAEDGTPLLDIKPYTPSNDRVEHPKVPQWCEHWPKSLEASGEFDWESEFNF